MRGPPKRRPKAASSAGPRFWLRNTSTGFSAKVRSIQAKVSSSRRDKSTPNASAPRASPSGRACGEPVMTILRLAGERKARWLIWIHDRPQHDAAFLRRVIAGAAVHRCALVPDQQVADLPGMVIDESVLRRMRRQFLDQRPGFLPVHADEAVGMHRIDEQDRAAGDGMMRDRRARLLVILLLGLSLLVAIQLFAGGPVGAAMQPG